MFHVRGSDSRSMSANGNKSALILRDGKVEQERRDVLGEPRIKKASKEVYY